MHLRFLLGPMRLPFLVLTPVCALLGLGTSLWERANIDILHFVLALIACICAHISVNAFNEYFDFKSGLDFKTAKTPFSGGSGTLQAKPELAKFVLILSIAASAITAGIGVYFFFVWGWPALIVGIAGLLLIVLYTPIFARNAVACLIAPGLGFGPVMVMGTHFALTGAFSLSSAVASLIPFFLVSNLLFLNQYPDVEADKSIGRSNFPIILGRRKSGYIYTGFLFLTFGSIVFGVISGLLPAFSLIGLATIVIALPLVRGIFKFADDIPGLMPYMGMNVLVNLFTPLLVAIGLIIA